VITVTEYDEAIALANGTGYGLQMAVFTRDIDKGILFCGTAAERERGDQRYHGLLGGA